MPLQTLNYPTSVKVKAPKDSLDALHAKLEAAQAVASKRYDELIADGYKVVGELPYLSGLFDGVCLVMGKTPSGERTLIRE